MTRQQKTVTKIIEIKEITREQIEAEVKKARLRLDDERKKLEGLEEDYRKTSSEFANKQAHGSMSVHEVDLFTTYLKHVAKQIDLQNTVMALRAQELDLREKAMVEAYKEQRLLELLQDKMQHEEVRLANLGEQKDADSSFLQRKAGR